MEIYIYYMGMYLYFVFFKMIDCFNCLIIIIYYNFFFIISLFYSYIGIGEFKYIEIGYIFVF